MLGVLYRTGQHLAKIKGSLYPLMRNEPLVIIDDDLHDLHAMQRTVLAMGLTREVIVFDNAVMALDFIRRSIPVPIAIICRIDNRFFSGFQLRAAILGMEDCPARRAPFIFFSRSYTWESIGQASELEVHAVFRKTGNETELRDNLQAIFGLLLGTGDWNLD